MSNPPKDTLCGIKAGTALPVIVAPMFLVSDKKLVLASCKEGLVGSFPAGALWTSAAFEQQLIDLNDGIDKLKAANPGATIGPYAVNITFKSTNKRVDADIDLCVKHKVPIILASHEATQEQIDKIHAYGGIVLHDAATIEQADKAVAAGADGIIAIGAGAGGQAGTMNPIALVSGIREFFDGPIILAGCLNTGHDILAAQSIGADMVVMGTRFIATAEANAEDAYKQMIVDARSSDIIYTSAISGAPGNFLRQSLENCGYDVEDLKKKGASAAKIPPPPGQESRAWKYAWSAGQGVSGVHDIPTVQELSDRLKTEYAAAKTDLAEKLNLTPPPKAPPPATYKIPKIGGPGI
ncbi:MAG: nitronate monooxygenase [Alphaproteobacteria bacterium]|nr:MAG: nitronate monooxygenase [Alphaproteobacteria bacterium]